MHYLLNLMLQRKAAHLLRSHRLLALVNHVAALFGFLVFRGKDLLARLLTEVRILLKDLRHIFLARACKAVATRVRVDLVTVTVLVSDDTEALTFLPNLRAAGSKATNAQVGRLGRNTVRRQCRSSTLMRLLRKEIAVLTFLGDTSRVELRH